MSQERLHLVVPGPLDQRTGGYLYDARMAAGLERLGWSVIVHSLEGAFPLGDERAADSMARALAALYDGERVLIDGLALGPLPEQVVAHGDRLRIVGLVHHPLADETGLTDDERARFEKLERAALGACEGVIVTSPFTASRLAEYGAEPALVRVVPPGTNPGRLAVGPRPGEPPRLLCVGTISPRKGQDVLVRALARLRHMPWTCVCAGSLDRAPEFAVSVARLARDLEVSERVTFVGEANERDLDELYHGASVFVLPSWYEGYGMAYAEALARGLPIVGTTGGAVPGTVPPAASILVSPGDDVALVGALGHLLASTAGTARRARLAGAAREHALTLPSWDRAAQLFAKALIELAPEV